jgi:NADP-dependent alcohol dehydrogenase
MNVKRNEKKEKILQYGERVWNIERGDEDERVDQAIALTILFFERMGIPTRLSDYGVPVETISKITSRFNKRGIMIGEKGDIGPGEIKLILQNRL